MKGFFITIAILVYVIFLINLIFHFIKSIFGNTVVSPEQLKEDYKNRVVEKYTRHVDRKIYRAFAKKNLGEVACVFNTKMKDADLDILKDYYKNRGFNVEKASAGMYGKIKPTLTFKGIENV